MICEAPLLFARTTSKDPLADSIICQSLFFNLVRITDVGRCVHTGFPPPESSVIIRLVCARDSSLSLEMRTWDLTESNARNDWETDSYDLDEELAPMLVPRTSCDSASRFLCFILKIR